MKLLLVLLSLLLLSSAVLCETPAKKKRFVALSTPEPEPEPTPYLANLRIPVPDNTEEKKEDEKKKEKEEEEEGEKNGKAPASSAANPAHPTPSSSSPSSTHSPAVHHDEAIERASFPRQNDEKDREKEAPGQEPLLAAAPKLPVSRPTFKEMQKMKEKEEERKVASSGERRAPAPSVAAPPARPAEERASEASRAKEPEEVKGPLEMPTKPISTPTPTATPAAKKPLFVESSTTLPTGKEAKSRQLIHQEAAQTRGFLGVYLPIMGVVLVLGMLLVGFLYQRGHFSQNSGHRGYHRLPPDAVYDDFVAV